MAAEPLAPVQSASEYDYPPFSIVKPDGQADGFAVELMRATLHAMGREVQFKVGPWHEIKQELAEGHIQALPLVARTAERDAFYDFTSPYLSMHGTIVVRKGDTRIRRAEDLRDKAVVVMRGDIAEEYVLQHHLSDKIATTKTLEEALRQLAAGQHDAMVVQALAGENLIRSLGLTNLETAGPPLNGYQDFCFAVRDGDKELLAILNEGLALVIADGTRERLREKWITPTRDERFSYIRNMIAVVLGTLLLAGLVAYLWLRSLHAQVKNRTQELLKSEQAMRKSEEALRLGEEQMAASQRIGGTGSWVYSIATNGIRASANSLLLFGFPPDDRDYPLDDFLACIPERDRVRQVLAAAINEGRTYEDEFVMNPADGSPSKIIHSSGRPEKDAQGNPLRVFGFIQDITESVHVKKTLQESEARFRAIIEASPIPYALNDSQQNIIYLNTSFIRTFGYTLVDIPNLAEWWPQAYPDPAYRQWVATSWQSRIEKSMQGNAPFEPLELNIRCKDGAVRVALVSAAPVGASFNGVHLVLFYDITERKQIEEKLYQLNRDFVLFLENTTDFIYFKDENSRFLFCSQPVAAITGHASWRDLIGKHDLDVFPKDTAKIYYEEELPIFREGKPLLNKIDPYYDAEGGKGWVSTNKWPVFDDGGKKVVGIFGISRDITAHQKTVNALTRSEQHFRAFFERSMVGMAETSPEKGWVEVNDRLCEMLGYSREKLVHMTWEELTHPDDLAADVAQFNRVLAGDIDEYTMDKRFIHSDGHVVYTYLALRCVRRKDGTVDYFVAMVEDITERKLAEIALQESELRWKFAIEGSGDGLWDWNVKDSTVFFTKRWKEMLGYSEDEIDNGLDEWEKRIHPDDKADTMATVQAHLDGKTTVYQSEHRVRCKDGSYKWILDRGMVVNRSEDGKPLRMIGTHTDITARKEFEDELLRSNAELEQFSYAVSHDMRQPLRMISSYLQLIERSLADQLDAEKRDYFNFAIDGAKRIDQMLIALLEYSRVGRMGEPPTEIESRTVLDEALQFLQPAITEAQARLNISGDWPRIFASHDEILRLLQNLIGNAAKFRVVGRVPEITITGEMVGNEWHLCIADNGVGIIPSQIKRLFQMFQRQQSRTAYEGNGIGLALCRKIAEHHKGRIWAESAGEGLGSRFCVVLPCGGAIDEVQ